MLGLAAKLAAAKNYCDDVSPMESFDLFAFQGIWYEQLYANDDSN